MVGKVHLGFDGTLNVAEKGDTGKIEFGAAGETFSLQLKTGYTLRKTAGIPYYSTDAKAYVTNYTFTLTFTVPGVYTYTVTESGEVEGVKAVYTVKELPVENFMTSYQLADSTSSEYADNGGTITNTKIPQTGDPAPLAVWLTLMGASAAMLMLLLKRRRV